MNTYRKPSLIGRMIALLIDAFLIYMIVTLIMTVFYMDWIEELSPYDLDTREAVWWIRRKMFPPLAMIQNDMNHSFYAPYFMDKVCIITYAVSLCYFVILESLGKGLTIGKVFFRYRVISRNGAKARFSQILSRNMYKCIYPIFLVFLRQIRVLRHYNGPMLSTSLLMPAPFWLFAAFAIFGGRALWDLLAGTKVVKLGRKAVQETEVQVPMQNVSPTANPTPVQIILPAAPEIPAAPAETSDSEIPPMKSLY